MSMFYVSSFISQVTLRRFLRFLHDDFAGKTLYLYINSIGGCTRSALAMFEILRTLSEEQEIEIVTQAFDECYSAALLLFLAGDSRWATKHSSFLIHEVTVDDSKRKTAEGYKRTAVDLEKETSIIFDVIRSRSKLKVATIKKKVKEAKDNDWIFGVAEAKRLGIVTDRGFYMPDLPPPEERMPHPAQDLDREEPDDEEDDDDEA